MGEVSEARERFTFSLTHKYKYRKKNAKKHGFDSLKVTPFTEVYHSELQSHRYNKCFHLELAAIFSPIIYFLMI